MIYDLLRHPHVGLKALLRVPSWEIPCAEAPFAAGIAFWYGFRRRLSKKRLLMKTCYLGIELRSPVVIASSPYTAQAAHIEHCAAQGAGAVVLKSIFEEQILRHAAWMERVSAAAATDAGEYLERYLGDAYRADYLRLIGRARDTGLPVIASINCIGRDPSWVEYAAAMERAGASALELNIFLPPSDRQVTAAEVERNYAEIVRGVTSAVTLPVAVKLPLRLTNFLHTADALLARGARGVVLFNRFFEPDIDIERLALVPGDPYSHPGELRNVLRSAAFATRALPQLDVAVSTGVHDGEAAVKAILAGARAVEICTAIHRFGYETIGRMNHFIDRWAEVHGFAGVEAFRGRADYGDPDDELAQRVQYMRFFPAQG